MLFTLNEITTLPELESKYNISRNTLYSRLKNLTEGIDYKKMGLRMPILLSPSGVEKLIGAQH